MMGDTAVRGRQSRMGYGRLLFLVFIAAVYLAIPNARPDFTRFNCHDSESYLALSYSMAHGFGYTRSMIPDAYVGHTTWPPGLPLLMLPSVLASGKTINWYAVKLTTICIGIIGIVIVWHLGRRLSGRNSGGDLAGAMIALNPLYWDFSHQAMAELPMTVWMLAVLLCMDRYWAHRRPTLLQVCAVAFLGGMGMLFKGHAIALLLAPLAYWCGDRASLGTWKQRIKNGVIFGCIFTIPFACWGIRNQRVDASGFDGINQVRMVRAKNSTEVNSPLLSARETVEVVKKNALTYGIYRVPSQSLPFLWHPGTYSWPGSGYLFLLLNIILLWLIFPWNFSRLSSLHLVCLPIIGLNLIYPIGGSERFWFPVSIFCSILVGVTLVSLKFERRMWKRSWNGKFLFALVVALMGLSLAGYVANHERHPYASGPLAWAQKAELFEKIGELDLQAVGIAILRNCHALQLMTGIPAPMTADGPVDYAVVDIRKADLLSDSRIKKIEAVFPWGLYQLPEVMEKQAAMRLFEGAGTGPSVSF